MIPSNVDRRRLRGRIPIPCMARPGNPGKLVSSQGAGRWIAWYVLMCLAAIAVSSACADGTEHTATPAATIALAAREISAAPTQTPSATPTAQPTAKPTPTPTATPTQTPTATPTKTSRLEQVRDRGTVICAGRDYLPGLGYRDDYGNVVGFDIDLCRAVAAAVLGDPDAIVFRRVAAAERGPVMRHGAADMLVTVAWTSSRDALWGNFAQTMLYDGQGFMVHKVSGISSVFDLKDETVCVQRVSTTELNVVHFSDRNGLNISLLAFEDFKEALAAYEREECSAVASDRLYLAVLRLDLSNPDAHFVLPQTTSEEPLGPVVPHGDEEWFDIVKTVMSILIYSEAYGVDSGSVPTSSTGDWKVDRLFGISSTMRGPSGDQFTLSGWWGQEELGISKTVAQDVIRAVGNYGEIYDRNLGQDGIGLPREGSRNALWADAPCVDCPKGGQIYAVPLR